MTAQISHKNVFYDVKNLKVHYYGRWGVPKGDQLFTERDYVGGKVVILEEINGDYLNMMDLNCLICQECQIGPDCIRNLIYLFDGVRLEIENDRELMAMWADSKADADGFTHIFLDCLVPCERAQEKLLIEWPQLENRDSLQAPQLTPQVTIHIETPELPIQAEERSEGQSSPSHLVEKAGSPENLTTQKRKLIPVENVINEIPEKKLQEIPKNGDICSSTSILDEVDNSTMASMIADSTSDEEESKSSGSTSDEDMPIQAEDTSQNQSSLTHLTKKAGSPENPITQKRKRTPIEVVINEISEKKLQMPRNSDILSSTGKLDEVGKSTMSSKITDSTGDEEESNSNCSTSDKDESDNNDSTSDEEYILDSNYSNDKLDGISIPSLRAHSKYVEQTGDVCSEENKQENIGHDKPTLAILSNTLELGRTFLTMDECRSYLRSFAINSKFAMKFIRNEPNRIIAVCKAEGCPWICYIRKASGKHKCQVTKLKDKHLCQPVECHDKTLEKPAPAVANTVELGMIFPTMNECRSYLRRFAIHDKFEIKFIKNEPNRIRTVCKSEGCSWLCNIRKGSVRHSCKVSKLNNEHSCERAQQKLLIEEQELHNEGSQQAPQVQELHNEGSRQTPHLTPQVSEHTSPLESTAQEEDRAHCPSADTPSNRKARRPDKQTTKKRKRIPEETIADTPSNRKARRPDKQTTKRTKRIPEETTKKMKRIPEESTGYRKKTTQAVADTFELELGMMFPTMAECRSYLRKFAIHNKFKIKFIKSECGKIRAICKVEGCSWRCYIVKGKKRRTYKVNRLNTKHSCDANTELGNSMANPYWIAEVTESEIRKHGNIYSPKDIQAEIWNKYAVNINYWVAYRARKRALERIGKCDLKGNDSRTCKKSPKRLAIDKGETGKLTKKSRGKDKKDQNAQPGRNASKTRGKMRKKEIEC